jgi:hypothetical protein
MMGSTDGHGESMYEEAVHPAEDKSFLKEAAFAIGAGEVDPDEDED